MDVEPSLLDWFTGLKVAGRTTYAASSTPSDLDDRLADGQLVLRVKRIGGGSDPDNDNPTISVQCFALASPDTPRAAWDLDSVVEEKFFEVTTYGPQKVGDILMESPDKTSGPVEMPWPNAAITVVESIYRFAARR